MPKLSRRNFLKDLGLTICTVPFLKLPEPPAPEPVDLQEEYNERVIRQSFEEIRYIMSGDWSSGCWIPIGPSDSVYREPQTFRQNELIGVTRTFALEPPNRSEV